MDNLNDLLNRMFAGSISALARLISIVENGSPGSVEVLQKIYPKTGHAYTVGITGPPGSGKSTLTDGLAKMLRLQGYTVGIVAVDPSSPFSGGALLGDRLRMQHTLGDDGVFFRSMSTRGAMGGLARATAGAVKLLDAFGKDYILIETVGVGQDEVDIVGTADSVVLVAVPGLGDQIQALKAGVMEIGDIYVVNKADRDGADRLVTELKLMRDLASRADSRVPPILTTVAVKDEGISGLAEQIQEHRAFLENGDGLLKRRNERIRKEIIALIEHEISKCLRGVIEENLAFDEIVRQVAARSVDPYALALSVSDPFARYCEIHRRMGRAAFTDVGA